jgi:hypothetical protein
VLSPSGVSIGVRSVTRGWLRKLAVEDIEIVRLACAPASVGFARDACLGLAHRRFSTELL